MIRLYFSGFFKTPLHSAQAMAAVLMVCSYVLVAINSGMFFTACLHPDFPLAYTFTLVMAYLFSSYIYNINAFLERKTPYRSNTLKRLKQQLAWGVAIPVFTELLLVSLYFWFKDHTTILENDFFNIDFILVLAFMIMLNAFYIHALDVYQYKFRVQQYLTSRIYPAMDELAFLKKRCRLTNIRRTALHLNDANLEELGIAGNEIACICKIDKKIMIFYFDGSQEIGNIPVSKHFSALETEDYFMINPSSILHRVLIYNWQPVGKSRQLWLTLRHPFNRLSDENQRLVSQGNAKSFRVWFDQQDEPVLS